MKKNILVFLAFISGVILYSQELSKEEAIYERFFHAEKVIINKTVASYTLTSTEIKNGEDYKNKIKSDINLPYYIFIKSNEISASIRINSQKIREDIVVNFKSIYKYKSDDSIIYEFLGNENYTVFYNIPNDGSHHNFYLEYKDENKTGTRLFFIISKYEQL